VVKQRIELTEGQLQAAFLISRAIRNTKLGQEITEALADYALPILSVRIMQRVLYPTSAASGTTVLDVEPHGEAAKEIRALMHEMNLGIQLIRVGKIVVDHSRKPVAVHLEVLREPACGILPTGRQTQQALFSTHPISDSADCNYPCLGFAA
jgi:hypothetical protein